MKVRLFVDVDLAEPVDDDELDKWTYEISCEFGERLRLDAPVTAYSDGGWELVS